MCASATPKSGPHGPDERLGGADKCAPPETAVTGGKRTSSSIHRHLLCIRFRYPQEDGGVGKPNLHNAGPVHQYTKAMFVLPFTTKFISHVWHAIDVQLVNIDRMEANVAPEIGVILDGWKVIIKIKSSRAIERFG